MLLVGITPLLFGLMLLPFGLTPLPFGLTPLPFGITPLPFGITPLPLYIVYRSENTAHVKTDNDPGHHAADTERRRKRFVRPKKALFSSGPAADGTVV
jgi:hypothetical protein